MAVPDLTNWDAGRASQLAIARRRATGLLILTGAIFLVVHVFTDSRGIWGFIEAAAEAGVVGGMADWFAVTALFRHPLGVPIPHTAVITKGKDAFGQSLGEFVANNFLNADQLTLRLTDLDPARYAGRWLIAPGNAAIAAKQAASIVAGVADALNDEEVQANLQQAIEGRLRKVEAAPLLGRAIDAAMEGGHHHALFDAVLSGLERTLAENREVLRDRITQESPWWVPEPVDEIVFEKVYVGINNFLADLAADPNHEIRRHIDRQASELALKLVHSPELIARGEELKAELLDHPEFKAWSQGLWEDIKAALRRAAAEPESELRTRLEMWARELGHRLMDDAALRERVNTWVVSLASAVASNSGPEVTKMISSTVEKWDAEETSGRLELLLGRDLQFIRINGTLVGGLVGVLIHTLVVLL